MSKIVRTAAATIMLSTCFGGGLHANESGANTLKQELAKHVNAGHATCSPGKEWALALSGGGTRSASFSMGVLGQLQSVGALDQFCAISSVSGGGFAAYFYYLHMARQRESMHDREITTATEPYFDLLWRAALNSVATNADDKCVCFNNDPGCRDLAERHAPQIKLNKTNTIIETCLPAGRQLTDFDVFTHRDNFAEKAGGALHRDNARHQLHVSSWRDVLAGDDAKFESLGELNSKISISSLLLSPLGASTAISTIPHFFANSIFDWRLNFSPTQERYQAGIHRTYGVSSIRREWKAMHDEWRLKCRPLDKSADHSYSGYEESLAGLSEINRDLDILCLYEPPNVSVRQICAAKTGELIGKENATCRRDELRKRITLEAAMSNWKPLEFKELAEATEKNSLPLWIINTSVGKGGMALDLSVGKTTPFHETNFEFTPFEVGSRSRGILQQDVSGLSKEAPSNHYGLSVLDAVATSAAFFDPQQQDGSAIGKVAKGAGMHFLNTKWGRDIPNHKVGTARRVLHHVLPFPLYYLNGYLPGMETPYLHLSDGGHASDNLGIYALIQRGHKKIVAVDGSFDADGKLDDLCYLRWNLAKYHSAEIEFAGAASAKSAVEDKSQLSLEKICGEIESSGYDPDNIKLRRAAIHRWSNPVEHLQVRPNSKYADMNPDCPREVSAADNSSSKCPSAQKDVVDIFYIKLAMNLTDWLDANELLTHYKDVKPIPTLKRQFQTCTPSVVDGTRIRKSSAPPCTLSVFIKTNLPNNPEDVTSSGWSWIEEEDAERKATGRRCLRPIFPQHQTVSSTLDGSRRSYYAYRDLGAYATRTLLALKLLDPKQPRQKIPATPGVDRYLQGTCDPLLYPMESSLLSK